MKLPRLGSFSVLVGEKLNTLSNGKLQSTIKTLQSIYEDRGVDKFSCILLFSLFHYHIYSF